MAGSGIDAANWLTRRWVGELPAGDDTVISGVGAWMLLAALLAGSDGSAERELAEAVGVERRDAAHAFDRVGDVVAGADGLSVAAGLWTASGVELRAQFVESLRHLTVAQLPDDPAELDRWARNATDGMIQRFPVTPPPDARLCAATALAADAGWVETFDETTGFTWSGTELRHRLLRRSTPDLGQASTYVGDTTISSIVCATTGGLDVHLVAGPPDASAAAVLATAIDAVAAPKRTRLAAGLVAELAVGERVGCIEVVEVTADDDRPRLVVEVPAFDITATHDLVARSDLFGLESATDERRGHFPLLADEPLAVDTVVQQVRADFSAVGFRAAAVTAAALVAGSAPPQRLKQRRTLRAAHDRPFGVVATERATGLVLFAAWLHHPPPFPGFALPMRRA